MPIFIETPQEADTDFSATVNGLTYLFTQTWCDRTLSWYLTISQGNGTIIKKRAKLLEAVPLVTANRHLVPNGNFYLVKQQDGYKEPVGRDNVGLNREYGLAFVSDDE